MVASGLGGKGAQDLFISEIIFISLSSKYVSPGVSVEADVLLGDLDQLPVDVQADDLGGGVVLGDAGGVGGEEEERREEEQGGGAGRIGREEEQGGGADLMVMWPMLQPMSRTCTTQIPSHTSIIYSELKIEKEK